MKNMTNRTTVEAVYEHTHKYLLNEFWSKGGSREHRDVVLLPRDLI